MESPTTPSVNISAQPSTTTAVDYSVHYQKLQPTFKDCTFDSDQKPEYLRTWLRLLSGIVRNIPNGKPIENFLDHYLQRHTNKTATRPAFLNEIGLQLTSPEFSIPEEEAAEASSDDPSDHPTNYYDLSPDAQALDKALFHTLFTIVQGTYLDLITDLYGESARYTFAIIAMWRHGELGSSTRRIVAMNKMQELQYHGDASKWKFDFIGKAREVYSSKLSIEHFIMHCAFKSFEGKNTQVQSMIASDINSDKVGPDMSLEQLAGNYSQFLSTLSAGKTNPKINNVKDTCNYCGKAGHYERDCRKKIYDKGQDPNKDQPNAKGGRGRGRGNPKGGRGRGERSNTTAPQDPPKVEDKPTGDVAKPISNAQISEKAVSDLCQRIQTGEIKLQMDCALESIEVGSRDSSHGGDLSSMLDGHLGHGEAYLSRNDHSEPTDGSPMFMAGSPQPEKPKDKIVLSLCDGMGCMALALRPQWEELGFTRYIGVDIFDINEDHIKALPKDSTAILAFGAMCNDFSKLRLLPDRLDFKGPPRKPGVAPRQGLNGKYGKTLRKGIEILGWVTKYHPNDKDFSENVEFSDMREDWKEVCDALGKPHIINSQDHSYTCRRLAG